MDPLDRAQNATLAAQEADTARIRAREVPRRLTPGELSRLHDHLLDTEMPVPEALHALNLGTRNLHLDDLDRLATHIARCRHCNTWTRLAELVDGACPDCLDEQGVV